MAAACTLHTQHSCISSCMSKRHGPLSCSRGRLSQTMWSRFCPRVHGSTPPDFNLSVSRTTRRQQLSDSRQVYQIQLQLLVSSQSTPNGRVHCHYVALTHCSEGFCVGGCNKLLRSAISSGAAWSWLWHARSSSEMQHPTPQSRPSRHEMPPELTATLSDSNQMTTDIS